MVIATKYTNSTVLNSEILVFRTANGNVSRLKYSPYISIKSGLLTTFTKLAELLSNHDFMD